VSKGEHFKSLREGKGEKKPLVGGDPRGGVSLMPRFERQPESMRGGEPGRKKGGREVLLQRSINHCENTTRAVTGDLCYYTGIKRSQGVISIFGGGEVKEEKTAC